VVPSKKLCSGKFHKQRKIINLCTDYELFTLYLVCISFIGNYFLDRFSILVQGTIVPTNGTLVYW
jgi:hypothetical protein